MTPALAGRKTPGEPQDRESNGACVALGPQLPMAVYTSTVAWNPDRIGALALYCSDGRWGEAFDEFCHLRLQIPRYDRWAVPGGPAWLVPRDDGRHLYHTTREQLDFLVRVHELERLVLIGHYGCAFYTEMLRGQPDDCLHVQTNDLHRATQTLKEWFPEIRVEAFLAMRQGKCLSFHQFEV